MSANPTPTAALSASSFVQSIGVNVHMAYTWTPYANVAAVETELGYLGVDKVRDVFWPAGLASFEQLAASGTKIDFILPVYQPSTVNLSQFTSLLDSFAQAHPGSISAIEGPNEVNIQPGTFDGGTTPADQAALQAALYSAVNNDPNLRGIPVYALTIGSGSASAFQPYGDLSSYANYANAHSYLPDNSTPQSALQNLLPIQTGIDTPGLPIVITETGWTTDPSYSYNGADQTTQAKLTLDTLVDAFKDGVSTTYLYELIDEAPDPGDANSEDHYGLFNYDGTPKAAAEAIHNLTSILADPNSTSSFTPGTLSYAVPNLPANGNQLLLQKSGGTFDLVLWAEASIWNANTHSEIAAPSQNTTINFATTQKSVLIFDPLLGSAPIAAYLNVQSIQVALADHPIIIEIPSSTATLSTPTITGFVPNSGSANSGTLTGTATANCTVLVFDGNTEIGTATANGDGAWSFTSGTLAHGLNALTAMAVDTAGDVSALSAAFNVTNAATGPAAPIMVPMIVDETITSTNQVILSGTGEANSTVSVFDGTTLLGTTKANSSGAWTYTTPALLNGDNTFAVTITDAAGNASAVSNPVEPVINLTGPTVTSIVASSTGVINGNGDLNAGHVVNLTVTMSEDVTVAGGTPTLTLNDGGTATYIGGTGTNILTFSYTVVTGQNTSALAVTAVNLNGATITDDGGSAANLSGTLILSGTLQIDTTPPAPPVISSDTLNSNNSITLTGSAAANSTVTVYDGQTKLGATTANASGAWSYVTSTLASGAHDFTATASDAAGNTSATSNSVDPTIGQPQAPLVISVSSSGTGITNGNGDLNAGHVVILTVAMSEDVTVAGGTPTLALNDGGIATYTGGSGSNALTFSYTIAAGQNTPDLAVTAVNLNGATIADSAGNNANFSGTLTPSGTLQIDTTTPTVASVAASGTGITNGNGDLNAGHVVTLTLTMSEVVTVAGGTPTLTLNDGATAIFTGGSGSNVLTFSYTVGPGQNTPDLKISAVNLNGATIADSAGNNANFSGTLTPSGTLQIDTTTPTVASVAASGTGITNGNGDLNAGHVVTLTLTMSEVVTVAGGTPTLTLNDGATAIFTGGSGSNVLTFSYTVGPGQNTPDLKISAVNLNGATIADSAGNNANFSGTLTPSGTLQIDTTTPTVASVAASGTGITNGNGDLNAGHVVILTLTMNEVVTVANGTPTLTLNDGGTATYTGGSGSNALTFSYTIAGGQNTPDLAVTAVNLNGATIADSAGNNANFSGTLTPSGTLQIDTTTPTVASVAASGTGITNGNGDLNAGHVVILTLTMNEVVTVANGTPTLTLNDGGTATYTGGSGSNALTFSYTIAGGQNTPDLAVTAVNLNGATIADSAGNNANFSGTLTPSGTLQIDTMTPTVASVAASGTGITNGNGDLNAGHVVTLTLTMSEVVTVAGGTPTLTLNDGATAIFTGGSGSNVLTFSYTVGPGQNTPNLKISAVNLNGATIADSAGNNANFSGTLTPSGTLQIDTTTPTVASVAASGTGITNGNGDLNAGHVVILTLTMNEVVTVANGTPTLALNDGGTATYTGGSGSNALTFSYTIAGGQNTPDLAVTAVNLNGATIADSAGNNANFSGTLTPSGTLQIDTTTPTAPVIANDAINANNSVTLSGTAAANSTVTVHDGQAALGTTTASAVGAWSYTTSVLGTGAQVFTATATDAAGNTSAPSNSVDPTISPSLATQITEIYNAVLQRAPTSTEVTASLAIESTFSNAGMVAAIVDSSEAITNVYPILLMFNLAFGHFPSATTLASMVDTGLTLPELAAGIVGSQTFANTYDGGTLINPNSPVTAGIVEALYSQALGHAPTQATLNGWLNSGLTVAQAFQDMVTSQSYFETTQPGIEQYLTTAANNAVGNVNANPSNTAGNLTATQINGIYEAVLQRAPTATEVTASMGLDSAAGNAATVAAIVDLPEAITNVYPILQMFDLAFGYLPSAGTLASMVDSELTLPQLAAAIVGSQTFANTYNGGTLINPNSPVTAGIVEALYSQALGHAPTQATLNGWLNSGLTVAQAFQDMVTSQSYFETTQPGIEQYLTTAANSEAGLTIIDETNATGGLTLGTTTMPLMQTSLTVLGGSGTLAVVAGGAGDTITELNTSTAGGTITANGAGDAINAANGANTITANGAGDHINLGAVSTGTSLTAPQIIHAAGAGDIITFATTAADATAVTWGAGASSTVDGGSSSTGIGVNDTINFGNNTASGSQTVVLTGDQTGATTSGGTSTSGIAMTTLGNVVDGQGDLIVFENASTEILLGQVNVSSATSLAHALDMAASAAAASQSGSMIGANTGVIDWFQYGGNTYAVEAINVVTIPATHSALAATDEVIKIVGLVNLSGESLSGHALTL